MEYNKEDLMKALFIINPSSGKQNIEATLQEIMSTLILKQILRTLMFLYKEKKMMQNTGRQP